MFNSLCLIFEQEQKAAITIEMSGKVRRMHARDMLSVREIAKRTGLSRNTLQNGFGLQSVFARAKSPKPVIDKLTAEIAKVTATPCFKQKAADLDAAAAYMTPQQLTDLSTSELARCAQVVKAAKIEAD